MLLKNLIVFSCMFSCLKSNAQGSSIPSEKETKIYIKEAIKANAFCPEGGDSFFCKRNISAYNQLKEKKVRVLKEYDLRLFQSIRDYSFSDSFYQYFYWNKDEPRIVFFKEDGQRNKVFASTHPVEPGSMELESISSASNLPEWDFFLNWERRDKSFLTLGYNGAWFIVKDNCMYHLKGDKMEKASDYFRANADKYTFEGLTRLFLGFHEGLYPVPK